VSPDWVHGLLEVLSSLMRVWGCRLWDQYKAQKKDFDVWLDEERKQKEEERKQRQLAYQQKL
jgi:hypothetical protein